MGRLLCARVETTISAMEAFGESSSKEGQYVSLGWIWWLDGHDIFEFQWYISYRFFLKRPKYQRDIFRHTLDKEELAIELKEGII